MPSIDIKMLLPLLIASIMFSPLVSEVFAESRVKIIVYKYQGAEEGPALNHFGVFKGIINGKLRNLKREVSNVEFIFDYKEVDTFSSATGVNRWIKNEPQVLSVLRGTIFPNPDQTYSVLSEIHMGDLEKDFKYEVISVELPVVKKEFSNTKDSHSAVFLYALAMDAKRSGSAKDRMALFLKPAADNISDIKRRRGKLSADLTEIENAIRHSCVEIFGDETWCFGSD